MTVVYEDIEKTEKVKLPKKVICNRCEKIFETLIEGYPYYGHNVTPIRIEFGFGSSRDGEVISFDLCDDCFADMILDFKHPVTRKYIKDFF